MSSGARKGEEGSLFPEGRGQSRSRLDFERDFSGLPTQTSPSQGGKMSLKRTHKRINIHAAAQGAHGSAWLSSLLSLSDVKTAGYLVPFSPAHLKGFVAAAQVAGGCWPQLQAHLALTGLRILSRLCLGYPLPREKESKHHLCYVRGPPAATSVWKPFQ